MGFRRCFAGRAGVTMARSVAAVRLRFEGWLYDGDRRQLFHGEDAVHVSPKAFDLLGALLAQRPRAVGKAQLKDLLWPDVAVSDANLPSLVAELRRALGDSSTDPRFLRTVPRFGYAFCAEAREVTERTLPRAPLSCRLVHGSREVELAPGENILGRAPEAAVWVDDTSVSRQHARILVSAEGAVIEDLGSKNGTFVGRAPVHGPTPLSDGDQVFLGSALVVFRARRPSSTRTISRG